MSVLTGWVLVGAVAPLVLVPGSAVAAPKPSSTCSDGVAETAPAALALAKACGRRVEVAGQRSEKAQVFVNPSGTATVEQFAVAVRAKSKAGVWEPIDTNLRVGSDGLLVPAVSTADVRFSAGGSAPLARLTTPKGQVDLTWPTPLPAPSIDGDSAVYPEVFPEVDLRVQALRDGFTHVLVVKTRAAAANPQVRQLRYGLGGKGVTVAPRVEGGLRLTDAAGGVLAISSAADVWDSSVSTATVAPAPAATASVAGSSGGVLRKLVKGGPDPKGSSARGPGDGARRTMAALTSAGGELRLEPDAAMLEDPATVYPVFVDPSYTIDQSQWAYATNNNSTNNDTSVARVGKNPDDGVVYRSFFDFPMWRVHGSQVVAATLSTVLVHSWNCANTPIYAYMTGDIQSRPRTGWSPGLTAYLDDNIGRAHKGNDACGNQPDQPLAFSAEAVRARVQQHADNRWNNMIFGFVVDESSYTYWKKLSPADTKLSVEINHAPVAPDQLTADGKPCVAGAGRPFVSTSSPRLRAHVVDPDGDSISVWSTVAEWRPAQGAFVDVVTLHQDNVPSGGFGEIVPGGLLDSRVYQYRFQVNDGRGTSPLVGWCEFQVDLTDPVAPAVTGTTYKKDSVGCPEVGCGGVGQAGSFTFASSADVVSYRWGFSDPPSTPVAPAGVGGAVSVAWTPITGGPKILFVQAIDRAGRTARSTYSFTVAGQSPVLARWRLNEPAGATTLGDATGHNYPATLSKGTLGVAGRIVGGDTVARFDGTASSGASTATPVLDTSRSFSVAAWVKLTDKNAARTAVSQAGTSTSVFFLQYSHEYDRWAFAMHSTDASAAAANRAYSQVAPRLGTWTHLVGVYDATAGVARLYVDGMLQSQVAVPPSWSAPGALNIGRARHAGLTDFWVGDLADVKVWDRAIDDEVGAMVDPMKVGRVGEWRMEDVGDGPTFDVSVMAHHLDFYGGTTIPAGGSGHTGTALRLDGSTGYAAAEGPVVATDQSFTVSAWVRLASNSTHRTAVSQGGSWSSAFFLQYNQPANRWSMSMRTSDDPNTAVDVRALSMAAPQLNTWTHLVGVYDATAGKARLYVNGALQSEVVVPVMGNATGPLRIGNAYHGGGSVDFWSGDIDDVRIYAGVVADVTRIP